ncbi:hypothetical protein [Evansella cellulosilytica]|uniref:Uncharacterized protein n=1 Tax=Evansella cellulosilytica (strain ATCC 21833 / DSM 2522 / FERM P-1141 / JCM 9156 / N-4) TaxID=649639 RepID=E6TZU2_EVAC2|nr:hypothetical protein [Evansella cellulosilytica]ADU32508.1 hypothetical protein Bcell_4281 [Evansella cellulosilytica DSM 2522]
MISKKIYTTQQHYKKVVEELTINQPTDKIEIRKKSHCIYFPNGVSIRIFAIQEGTKITVAKRPNRNNQHHFTDVTDFVEKRLGVKNLKFKNFGEIYSTVYDNKLLSKKQ